MMVVTITAMSVKECHKRFMTGNGKHISCKDGDRWAMVYGCLWHCFTHIDSTVTTNDDDMEIGSGRKILLPYTYPLTSYDLWYLGT